LEIGKWSLPVGGSGAWAYTNSLPIAEGKAICKKRLADILPIAGKAPLAFFCFRIENPFSEP
jgi:hypothetical protein